MWFPTYYTSLVLSVRVLTVPTVVIERNDERGVLGERENILGPQQVKPPPTVKLTSCVVD